MIKRGKRMWFPKSALEELETIKKEEQLITNGEAIRKLVKHAKIGRELDNIRNKVLFIKTKRKKSDYK